jgi:hypothetical protein
MNNLNQNFRSLQKTKTMIIKNFILIIPIIFFVTSCVKMKIEDENKSNSYEEIKNKFFNTPIDANSSITRIANKLKELNEKKEFISDFTKNNGFPVWGKLVSNIQSNNSSSFSVTTNSSGDTLVVLPFVIENSLVVNSYILAVLNGNITMNIFNCSDYKTFSFSNQYNNNHDSLTADKVALQTMLLTRHVFGNKKFKVKDHRLFSDDTNYNSSKPDRIVTLRDNTLNVSNNLYTIFQCSATYDWVCSVCSGADSNCPLGGSGTSIMSVPCSADEIFVMPPLVTGGFQTGGGSPPSGNGGVEPISNDQPLNSNTNSDSVINIINALCSTPSDTLYNLDSLYKKGMRRGFIEHGFIIVEKNGVRYPKNYKVGFESKCPINYFLLPGEEILAYCHVHSEDSVHFYKTTFSGQDLYEFDKNAKKVGYTALLDVGKIRYAFVLEDVGKHFNFNVSTKGRHVQNFENIYYPEVYKTTKPNKLKVGEDAWIQYLGSASNCGVGFYKITTNNGITTITKLNP